MADMRFTAPTPMMAVVFTWVVLTGIPRIVEKKMTELGNSLMHGDISIKPYEYEGRKPCEYCEFKNICAYEDGVDQVEKIKKVSLEEGKHALDQTTAESH